MTVNLGVVNDAPVAKGQTGENAVTTAEDTAVNVTLTATDADGDALSYLIVAGPTHGTLDGVNAETGEVTGDLSYIPSANFSGADSFTFKANDGDADSNVATVEINVTSGQRRAPNPLRRPGRRRQRRRDDERGRSA